jgi:hypothetical protein
LKIGREDRMFQALIEVMTEGKLWRRAGHATRSMH